MEETVVGGSRWKLVEVGETTWHLVEAETRVDGSSGSGWTYVEAGPRSWKLMEVVDVKGRKI